MLANCDVIVFLGLFWIYGQFGAIRKPDSGRIVCKTYIVIKNNFLSYKNWKLKTFYLTKTKKSLTQLSQYRFE